MEKFRFGLFAKISFSLTVLITLAMVLLGYILYSDARDKYKQQKQQLVLTGVKTLAQGSLDALVTEDYELLEFWLQSTLIEDYYAYAYLSRADGVILSHSNLALTATKSTPLGEINGLIIREISYQKQNVRELVYPAKLGNRHLANAHVGYYLKHDTFEQNYQYKTIILLSVLILFALFFALLAVLRNFTKPIVQLTEHATQLSMEHLVNRSPEKLSKRKDEIGTLAQEFDLMTERLFSAFESIKYEKARLEDAVNERTLELTEINKELESFSYSVSHDLRAPLRHINSYSKILQEDYSAKLDTEGKSFLQKIIESTRRMGDLIEDLLLLSRVTRQEIEKTAIDISAITRRILSKLRESEPSRDVEFTIPENIQIRGDKKLLTIALENLLGNAWKYTSKNTVTKITLRFEDRGNQVVLCVEDNGAGFNAKFSHKLFAPFQRLHSDTQFEGTGVGLATVKRIVHRHGGQVWADSEVNKYAAFYMSLPK